MKLVDRSELLDLGAYEAVREPFRRRIIALKKIRRVSLGPNMSLVFENRDTVLFQIQEMLRTERITDERSIAHEIETYNELVPGPRHLSATMFIEYEDPAIRREMLTVLAPLREQMHVVIGQSRATARFATHFGEEMERLPAVNYLSFELAAGAARALLDPMCPVRLESTNPAYLFGTDLPAALREDLARDLGEL